MPTKSGKGPSTRVLPDTTTVLGKQLPPEESSLPKNVDVMIVVLEGTEFGREYPIVKSRTTMGREGGAADIEIADLGVSRQHAEIYLEDGGWVLRDLESTNGTLKNGIKINRAPLKHGEKFKIGETVLQFLCEEKAQGSAKVYEIDGIDE